MSTHGQSALIIGALGLLTLVTPMSAADRDYRLVDAVKSRDTATIGALLRAHADVKVARADGTTPLHWTAQWNDLDLAATLIKAGANVNAQTDLGVAPLSLACLNGSTPMVDALLNAGANANIARNTGETALMTCARSGRVDAVKSLLAHGADLSRAEYSQGQNALMWASARNNADVIRLLVEVGADVHGKTTINEFTPLLFAAREGAADAVRALLASGADVNEASADNTTPLLATTYTGHWDLAKYLLDRGANPNKADGGYSPLHWAAGSWENDISGSLGPEGYEWIGGRGPGKLDLVKALLAHGADPNARLRRRPPRYGYGSGSRLNFSGATPFILAALGGDATIMRALLEAGADPLLTTDDGSTALMAAAGYGRIHGESRAKDNESLEAVKVAVAAGVDINAANKTGNMALHGAAYYQLDLVAQFLIEKGAKVNARNRAGETPLVIAEGFSGSDTGGNTFYSDTMAVLLRKAAAVNIMEFDAVVKKLETSCPATTFLVTDPAAAATDRGGDYGNSLRIKPTEGLRFKSAGCADLKVGSHVRITGTRLGHLLDKNGQPWDGSVDALEVEIRP